MLAQAATGEEPRTTIVGADGASHGTWVAVFQEANHDPELVICSSTDDLFLEMARRSAVLAVLDVPIGLPASGLRECDGLARRLLGPARSTVFLVPPRPVIGADSQRQATKLWRDLDGRGCPAQTFGLFKRIREVDRKLGGARNARVLEGHPELVFHLLAGCTPLASKHSPHGVGQRVELVASAMGGVRGWLASHPGLRLDVLDACACLVTARRVRDGQAQSLPAPPIPRDPLGLPMAIWY